MNTTKPPKKKAMIELERGGKDEMNLAEFPIHFMTNKTAEQEVKTLIFHDSHGKLIVTGSDYLGLPTPIDVDVLIAMIELAKKRNDFREANVNFTRYEVIRMMGWANVGSSYKRLEESMNRWADVLLIYDGNFWDNRLRKYRNETMHIIESVSVVEGKNPVTREGKQEALPLSSFTWSKEFIQSCRDNNLKNLDTAYYFSLRYPSSKQLFRFLDKRFYQRAELTFSLRDIGFERVGLSRKYNDSKLKEKLADAIEELESMRIYPDDDKRTETFLKPLARGERYFKTSEGWKIRFVDGRNISAALPSEAPVETAGELNGQAAELVNRGVADSAALSIAEQHAPEKIAAKIDEFDWLVERKDMRVAKNPAGFLVKSITTGAAGYKTPPGFVSRAERDRQAEVARQRQQEQAEVARQQQKQAAAERAEDAAILAYWQSLTPAQQAECQAAADGQADPEQLAGRNEINAALKSLGQSIRRRDYIRQLLRTRQEEQA